jgi:hypothetical protein
MLIEDLFPPFVVLLVLREMRLQVCSAGSENVHRIHGIYEKLRLKTLSMNNKKKTLLLIMKIIGGCS